MANVKSPIIPFLSLVLCVASAGCVRPYRTPPTPPPPAFYEHRVEKGETIGSIAKKLTGDSRNFKRIIEANPGLNPNKMAIGKVVLVPHELVAQKGAVTPKGATSKQAGKPGAFKSSERSDAARAPVKSKSSVEFPLGKPKRAEPSKDEMVIQGAATPPPVAPKINDRLTEEVLPQEDLAPKDAPSGSDESQYQPFSVGKQPPAVEDSFADDATGNVAGGGVTQPAPLAAEEVQPTPTAAAIKKRSLLEEMLDSQ